MKQFFLFCGVAALFMCGMNSCKSNQALAKIENSEIEVAIPLSGSAYQSDAEYWRVVQEGVSPDMSMAKKVAMQNARQELAATIRVQVRAVIDNYGKNMAVTENIEVTNMYEEQAYTVIDQTLAGAELAGEKLFRLGNGNYRYHVCLQVGKQYLEEQLMKAFEDEANLKAAFDKAQFKKVYDEQMKAFQESKKQ